MSEHPQRLFTLAKANASLPLVRRIVGDLLDLHPRWRDAVHAYEIAQHDATSESEPEAARNARVEAGRLAGEIESCLDELEQIGCLFKGFDVGLVDFPVMHDGRVVYLCWQFDDLAIQHWHETDAGFAGRRPLDSSFITAGAS